MNVVDDLTPDIIELLNAGKSAQAVAQELIVPLNDVLIILQQRRRAAGVTPLASPPSAPRLAAVRPLGEPAVTTPPPTSNLDLISRAKATGVAKLQRLADKAQQSLDSLTAELEDHETKAEARATVERLERELAEARAQLRPAAKTAAAPSSSVDSKAIRAWAHEHGVDVPSVGRIPRDVVDAYNAAHT